MSRDIPLHTGSTPAHAPRMAVADSATRGGATMGLLSGQDVLTVDTMQAYCTMRGAARASPHRGARCNGG